VDHHQLTADKAARADAPVPLLFHRLRLLHQSQSSVLLAEALLSIQARSLKMELAELLMETLLVETGLMGIVAPCTDSGKRARLFFTPSVNSKQW
jgi:hypothetical protein